MFMKGYSVSEVYDNGKHRFNEKALQYDGKHLQLLKNNNGNIQYEKITNDELLQYIGTQHKPIIQTLKDDIQDFSTKSKSKSKSRSKSITKSRSKSRSKSKSKTKSKTKSKSTSYPRTTTKSRTKSKSRSKPKTKTRKAYSERLERKRQITPDILKTIF